MSSRRKRRVGACCGESRDTLATITDAMLLILLFRSRPSQLALDLVHDAARRILENVDQAVRLADLPPRNEDDEPNRADENGEVVEAGRKEVKVADTCLDGESQLRRELR